MMVLIVGAMKLAGIVVTLSVAANVFSFSRYRRKFLRPFRSPIDESADVLAAFNVNSTSGPSLENPDLARFSFLLLLLLQRAEENGFFFGLATAPAHVEDKLDDAWLQFAEEQPCGESNQSQKAQSTDAVFASAAADGGSQQASSDGHSSKESIKGKIKRPLKIAMEAMIRGFEKFSDEAEPDSKTDCTHNVAAWHNVPHPQKRLRFWSDPDTELKLAKDTGITVFRLGIDWSRIMPKEPEHVLNESVNFAALERYRWIIERVRSYGMKKNLQGQQRDIFYNTSILRNRCMADHNLDSGFIYNEQGFVDILRSPFFDVNPEVDSSAEEYLELIIFTLSGAIEKQLSTVQWKITTVPRRG
ncbi:Beta-glucosidase-like SFR2, chloroplastic [Dendrobium catenatum]|uniref:Beta-glucosidase-like SFR2, chloroplastic n=1 Tax=Dendrobium catenatum TaxID=906689 RepID=A0A2I0X545_9ASPA|nr:Beta-glucosidase-like SFR2, chloroplastic [Dendrobium catenatum]